MRRLLPFWLVLASLPAVIGLLQDGFFASSDGLIHLYRLFELDRSLHAGTLYPRWFPLSGYGYGLPVLNYYPPFSYYLSELFHLAGAGYIAATKWLIASGFVVAAFSMFWFARDFLDDGAAFVAGVGFAYLPYLLSDAYVRGNFPEYLAMSLLPLALWAFRRVFESDNSGFESFDKLRMTALAGGNRLKPQFRAIDFPTIFAAFVYAVIIVTHHLTAMLFTALLFAYIAFLFAQRRDWKRLRACAGAILLALALSAFYWLPALAELNLVYVGLASVARFLVNRLINPADFFAPSLAYAYLPQSEALTRAPGFPQTMLALLAGVIVVLSLRGAILSERSESRDATEQPPLSIMEIALQKTLAMTSAFFFLLVAVSIFMTLTPSTSLWYAIPLLRFLQFPWRFQVLAGIGIAFLLGVWAKWVADAVQRFKVSRLTYPVFAIALIVLGIMNLPVRAFSLSDADLDLRRSNDPNYVVAQMGWGWTREFVPATVPEFEAIYTPFVKPNPIALAPARPLPSVKIQDDGLLSHAFQVATQAPFELSLHTFFYPGWQAYVDGAPARTYPRGGLGLVTVTVPPGDHAVMFRFEDTLLRVVADMASLITFVGMLVGLFVVRRRVFVGLIAALIVIAGLFAWHTRVEVRASPPIARAADLEQRVMLIGYSSERADDKLYVTLHWLALQDLNQDYSSFVHLLNAAGEILAQDDGIPDQGLTPTTRWLLGEIVTDRRVIPLQGVASGDYRLAAGMYLPLENGFENLGDLIDLGRVQVE